MANYDPDNPPTLSDPWTPEELAASQNWANNYYVTHQIPVDWGTPDDIANAYLYQRKQGLSHQAALDAAPGIMGWDKYQPQRQADPPAPTPPPPGPGPAPAPVAAPAPTAQSNPGAQAAPGNIPNYSAPPAYVKPPAFSYDPFNAPAPQDLLNDPSYQFEFGQGMQAIGAKNAALGTLNTGGTIKDFESYGQNLASTRYNDLWNRKASEYTLNRSNALDTYNTNYGTQYKDPYAINYQSQYVDPFAFGMQSAGLQQNNNQFNASLGQNNSQFNTSMDWQKFLQNYKATVTDPFSQKYSLLGLL